MNPLQKTLVVLAVGSVFLTSLGKADIQDPPMNAQNALTKLGRSLANIGFGITEVPVTLSEMNDRYGNAGMVTYGVVLGVGRTLVRLGAGLYEFVTFPVPTHRGGYEGVLPSVSPWIQGGYEEYPPELGAESRYTYSRNRAGYSRLP